MSPTRRGPLIGATWLIGLGTIFLVQRGAGWSWSQAWPMFVILAGVAAFVGVLVRGLRGASTPWSLTWPIVWIVVGALLLGSTTGSLQAAPGDLIAEWWPWALIVLGIWFLIGAFVTGGHRVETLTVPLGDAKQAEVRIKFGGGELVTHRAAPGALVDGSFQGGVRHRVDSPGRVELRQDPDSGVPWFDHESRWDVGLTAEVPLDLRLDVGAYRGTVDLRDLRIATLELHTGASDTMVRLPKAAGATSVMAQAGAASLTLEVPMGVAARIRTRMALGTSQVDQARFPRVGDVYQSVDYATAANRVDIDAQGGVGAIKVVGGT